MTHIVFSQRFMRYAGFLLLIGAFLLFATPTHAATITVTSMLDGGPGSFRQAVLDANNGDTIVFDPQTISLDNSIQLKEKGQIEISKTLTIDGLLIAGSRYAAISGDSGNLYQHRLFQIDAGTHVTLTNLLLGNVLCYCSGGGIYNEGTLTLIHDNLSSFFGWGNNDEPGHGGAVFNDGTLYVIDSIITWNSSVYGGAIYNSPNKRMYINNSYIYRNGPGSGASVINDGTALVNQTMFWSGYGCAIENHSLITITDSTFSDNASPRGGAIINDNGMGSSIANVYRSTFMDNRAIFGGAIFNNAVMLIVNSTFARNASTTGESSGLGGGIVNSYSGTLSILNSTLSNNWSDVGGGLYNSGTVTLTNTIVSNNEPGMNCYNVQGLFVDGGHNMEDANTCGFTTPGSFTNTNPLLSSIPYLDTYFFGYSLPTTMLLPGSPAIDAGDDAACPATDERGISRPIGSHCDIGAYEAFNRFWWLPAVQR